jgi:acetoacetyl-CoA synthetase
MEPLWQPSADRIADANITRFAERVGCADYAALHRFSVENKAVFWEQVWNFCNVVGEKGNEILERPSAMPGARWFPDASLNFAENLLRYRDEGLAIISILENGSRKSLTYAELGEKVANLAAWLRRNGVTKGDRVAAFMPNVAETVIAMLASSSVGATFSSCSPDFGIQGVLDRFGQIEPKVLVCSDGYYYNGREINVGNRVEAIVEQVPAIEQVLVVEVVGCGLPAIDVPLEKFVDASMGVGAPEFERLPFDHPLYIMYSSGTTGIPKCIVHGAGGTLLQHLKEHQLHVDLGRDDVLFYFTTCGWMMWNWLVSGLASGSTLVLYDGSPFFPGPNAMMDMAEREGITVFGTSAKYIASLEKARVRPVASNDLAKLHTILSTGSPLTHESFRYVYRDVKRDVCLSSISGGTDIVSCFALGNPTLPVYEGELQCLGLGMDVHIYNDEGESVVEEKGELVCGSPFPSMPVGFWNDEAGDRYRDAYFSRFPGIWAHGDYGEITSRNGMIIYGRSDAVLNPGGVRIGTAEIYRQVEKIDEVVDAICVGQDWQGDVRVVLFVVLREGVSLDDELVQSIRQTIRANTTPRHVPAKVLEVGDVPRTISGKLVELAVRNVIHGLPVVNTDALANPEALDEFRDCEELND